MTSYFDTSVEFIKGVGPRRAALLREELGIHTFRDLAQHYPFRYEDRTRTYSVAQLDVSMPQVEVRGQIVHLKEAGRGRRQRLLAYFKDASGGLELVWFHGIAWIRKRLRPDVEYAVFGKPTIYAGRLSMVHPEITPLAGDTPSSSLQPVYRLSEKLRSGYLNNRHLRVIQKNLLKDAADRFAETLPQTLRQRRSLVDKKTAMLDVHFPPSRAALEAARYRLKFEELFYVQLQLIKMKWMRWEKYAGIVFADTHLLTRFYDRHLPFALTGAQKRVAREIYRDMKSGQQMNRLLQGDVGSGKTIVAFLSMLLAIGSGAQCALMAPTEILARQHYITLKKYADPMEVSIAMLTGSTGRADRADIHHRLSKGALSILVGTHALIETAVQFDRLGLAVIDEQHRFGVAQRSRLWDKNPSAYPHVLVMTATPIPRTLAMTLYGDLDISTIDELPSGRKPIKTLHRYDSHRLRINQFIRQQMQQGQQVYVVYPLIEESEKLDLKYLTDGYESVRRAFPDVAVSIVHGKMKADAKEFEMDRFVRGETRIMVSTTVIEVGVDIPNASVMVIENAERFGLSQLHQLRGRVGRGNIQSYCILVTNPRLSEDAKVRMDTMTRTHDGFEIAETDLRLRGPGDLTGTQQSGVLELLIADLGQDGAILQAAREEALQIVKKDPKLEKKEHKPIRTHIEAAQKGHINWGRVS